MPICAPMKMARAVHEDCYVQDVAKNSRESANKTLGPSLPNNSAIVYSPAPHRNAKYVPLYEREQRALGRCTAFTASRSVGFSSSPEFVSYT